MTRFDGSNVIEAYDNERLTGQLKRVYDAMKDGNWRTLGEIEDRTGDNQASVSAQLRNLRKERFGSYQVEKRTRGDRKSGLFEYRVLAPIPIGQMRLAL
jgi:hypothetical protein